MDNYNYQQAEDEMFGSNNVTKNEYSTFIEELEESTEKLMDQVFNKQYNSSLNYDSRVKRKRPVKEYNSKPNKAYYKPHYQVKSNFNDQLNHSFQNFLDRNEKMLERKEKWIHQQRHIKKKIQAREITGIPDILRGSREQKEPIFERCLDIQKQQQKKTESKRIQKMRQTAQQINSYSFQPQIKTRAPNRTIEQYVIDKQHWQRVKLENRENRKIIEKAKELSQCTFSPVLVSKYKKKNPRIVEGEKVEDRLMRSLQKSEKSLFQ